MTTELRKVLLEMSLRKSLIPIEKKPFGMDFVFLTKNNTPISRPSVSRMSDRLREKIKKDYPDFPNFSPHCMRHTFASNMVEKGVSPKVLQILLGHGSIEVTMDTYCHVNKSQLEKAIETYDCDNENGVKMVSNQKEAL